jgi:hypothetical protein
MRNAPARAGCRVPFNDGMPNDRPNQPPSKDKAQPAREVKQDKGGRSGEGSRSVIPHLRADMKARAVARIAKRADAGF